MCFKLLNKNKIHEAGLSTIKKILKRSKISANDARLVSEKFNIVKSEIYSRIKEASLFGGIEIEYQFIEKVNQKVIDNILDILIKEGYCLELRRIKDKPTSLIINWEKDNGYINNKKLKVDPEDVKDLPDPKKLF